jgi:hypothetical protein
LGWDTVFDNKKLAICGKSCKIKKWWACVCIHACRPKILPIRRNPLFSGMSLLGRILRSEGYHVRLHLDIDSDQDVDAAFPFPWVPETGEPDVPDAKGGHAGIALFWRWQRAQWACD